MRVAAGILSLFYGLWVLWQAYGMTLAGTLARDTLVAKSGQWGIVVAFLMIGSGAFAFKMPGSAAFNAALAAGVGLWVGRQFAQENLTAWGVVALCFVVLNLIAAKVDRRAPKG